MGKDRLILLFLLVPAAFIMLLVTKNASGNKIRDLFIKPTPYPVISLDPTTSQTSTTVSPVSSQNIEILSPNMGDAVKSGFVVKGNARVFENIVLIRLTDSLGNILAQTFTTADAPDTGQYGPFEKSVNFSTRDLQGILEVYQASAKDGSEIDKVTIPVLFSR